MIHQYTLTTASSPTRCYRSLNLIELNQREGKLMNETRMFLRIFFVLITFGLISLLGTLDRPSMANIRAVDIVHLIGTGMCFGGAIVALVARLRGRHWQ